MDDNRPNLIEAFTFDDYCQMFALTPHLLQHKIFEFPNGLSSFNATAHKQNISVVSADPLYDLPKSMLENICQQQEHIWNVHVTQLPSHSKAHQIAKEKQKRFCYASNLFLDDYGEGKQQGRYITLEASDHLPFKDHSFQLALCSHWLFKQPYTLEQTILFIKELCRIAGEARIFPIINAKFETNEFIAPIMAYFQEHHYKISCLSIDFDKNEDGGAMLSIINPECKI